MRQAWMMALILIGSLSAWGGAPALAETRASGHQKCELPGAKAPMVVPAALPQGRYLHAMCELLFQLDTEVRLNGVEIQAEQKRLDSLDQQRLGQQRSGEAAQDASPAQSLDRLDYAIEVAGHEAETRHLERLARILEQALRAPRFNEHDFWAYWDQENERYRAVAESIAAVQSQVTVEMMKQAEEKLNQINAVLKEAEGGVKEKTN